MSRTAGYPVRLKPRSPSQLRDVPCGRAPVGLFDIERPGCGKLQSTRMRARRMQVALAMSWCNGIPGRPGCPFRAECLAWAFEAKEPGVYGGIEVTGNMIRRHHEEKNREAARAAEQAGAPPDQLQQLAEG